MSARMGFCGGAMGIGSLMVLASIHCDPFDAAFVAGDGGRVSSTRVDAAADAGRDAAGGSSKNGDGSSSGPDDVCGAGFAVVDGGCVETACPPDEKTVILRPVGGTAEPDRRVQPSTSSPASVVAEPGFGDGENTYIEWEMTDASGAKTLQLDLEPPPLTLAGQSVTSVWVFARTRTVAGRTGLRMGLNQISTNTDRDQPTIEATYPTYTITKIGYASDPFSGASWSLASLGGLQLRVNVEGMDTFPRTLRITQTWLAICHR